MFKVSRRIIWFSIFLLVAFSIGGYLTGVKDPNASYSFLQQLFPTGSLIETSPFAQFIFIFINNFVKAFFVMFLGILFAVVPIYFLAANGFLIGLTAASISHIRGWSFFWSGIIPHGVVELSALILASSYGIAFGLNFFRFLFLRKQFEFWPQVRFLFGFFFRVIAPLLFVAAIIEAFITPIFLSLVK